MLAHIYTHVHSMQPIDANNPVRGVSEGEDLKHRSFFLPPKTINHDPLPMLDPTLSMPPRGASNDPALRETTGRGNAGYVNTGTSAWEGR